MHHAPERRVLRSSDESEMKSCVRYVEVIFSRRVPEGPFAKSFHPRVLGLEGVEILIVGSIGREARC